MNFLHILKHFRFSKAGRRERSTDLTLFYRKPLEKACSTQEASFKYQVFTLGTSWLTMLV